MRLYLPGWGFRVDLLVYYFPITHYDVIVWSLGIARLNKLLAKRRLRFKRALFISCPDKMDLEEVKKFIQEYKVDPKRARRSFYRKCLWGTAIDASSVEKFFALKGALESDEESLAELWNLAREEIDFPRIAGSCDKIDLILAKKDLVVPYSSQLRLARIFTALHSGIGVREFSTGHFVFPKISQQFVC